MQNYTTKLCTWEETLVKTKTNAFDTSISQFATDAILHCVSCSNCTDGLC